MPRAQDIHRHSRESFDQLDSREADVLARIKRLYELTAPRGLTDRSVKNALRCDDMNDVRPTITRLLDEGWLVEDGETQCPETKRTVRLCRQRTNADPTRAEDRANELTNVKIGGRGREALAKIRRRRPGKEDMFLIRDALEYYFDKGCPLP